MENQKDIVNIFHDGNIVNIVKIDKKYLLTIRIKYLANIISQEYNDFYIEILDCENFTFFNWDDDKIYEKLDEILKCEPKILSCDNNVNNYLKIFCASSVGAGRNLNIKAKEIKVYDENEDPISLKRLGEISDEYWNNFRQMKSGI